MMWMEDWVLWNSERASGEVVDASWWELRTVVIESSLRNREGEDFRDIIPGFSAADFAFVTRGTSTPI
jgi:hypothetical protein